MGCWDGIDLVEEDSLFTHSEQALCSELVDAIINWACEDDPGEWGQPSRAGAIRVRLVETVVVVVDREDCDGSAVKGWFMHGSHQHLRMHVHHIKWRGPVDLALVGPIINFFPRVLTLCFWACEDWPVTTPGESTFLIIMKLEVKQARFPTGGLAYITEALSSLTEVHLWDGLWVHLSPGQFGLPSTLLDLSLDLETFLVWGLDDQLCCTWLSEKLGAMLEPWLARVRGLRSLSIRAQSKSMMLVVDRLLERNTNMLTRLEYNTGELTELQDVMVDLSVNICVKLESLVLGAMDPMVHLLVPAIQGFEAARLKSLWLNIHIVMQSIDGGVSTESLESFDELLKALHDLLSWSQVEELGFAFYYCNCEQLRSMEVYMSQSPAGNRPICSNSWIELPDDILKRIVMEACDGDPQGGRLLLPVSTRFYAMAEEIAAQWVEVVDYEGEYHSPEAAVCWFSHIDHWGDVSAATWLQWKAGTLLVNVRVGDVMPMPQMESIVLERCMLWFPELDLFLAALPTLQRLVIEGHGTVFERGIGVEAEYESVLMLPVMLSQLEVDARHVPEGAMGWYPGTNIMDDSQECLEVLTLALEHRRQQWNHYYDMTDCVALTKVSLSVTDAAVDLEHLGGLLGHLDSPQLVLLTVSIHIWSQTIWAFNLDTTNTYVIAAVAWIGPLLEMQAGISLRQVNLILYFYKDSYCKEVAEVYWLCFMEVRQQWNNVKVAREVGAWLSGRMDGGHGSHHGWKGLVEVVRRARDYENCFLCGSGVVPDKEQLQGHALAVLAGEMVKGMDAPVRLFLAPTTSFTSTTTSTTLGTAYINTVSVSVHCILVVARRPFAKVGSKAWHGFSAQKVYSMEIDDQGLVAEEENLDGQYKTSVLPGTTGYYQVLPSTTGEYLSIPQCVKKCPNIQATKYKTVVLHKYNCCERTRGITPGLKGTGILTNQTPILINTCGDEIFCFTALTLTSDQMGKQGYWCFEEMRLKTFAYGAFLDYGI
ncbi:hypothetical protein EDD85DRAFT_791957 [Armillaria nabsnona]|nr:hypothetical protein EDD85DRAFT_791957 [Armillaria nabsnona]